MKYLKLSVVAFILLLVVGCSLAFQRTTYSDGFDFPVGNVNKIIKGKTTADELIQMFGGPLSKRESGEAGEVWLYTYLTGIEIEEQGFLSNYEYSNRHRKTLEIELKNGIVTNLNFTDGD